MNRVTCQASADLQRPRTAPAPTPPAAGASAAAVGGGRPRSRAGATHTSAPTAAGAAQQASEPRQPRPNRSASGTASPTATAAEAPIAAVYSPVIAPVRSGKSRFTRLGTSTLPAVIASPSRAVPPSSVTTGPLERSRMPPLSTTRLASSVRSVPKRRAGSRPAGESRRQAAPLAAGSGATTSARCQRWYVSVRSAPDGCQDGPMHEATPVSTDTTGRLLERARALLARHPVVDGHNDLAWAVRELAGYDFGRADVAVARPELQTDIPRLRAGGVGAQFWSVYVPAKVQGDHAD